MLKAIFLTQIVQVKSYLFLIYVNNPNPIDL